jgi:hypothetical protein
MIESAEENRGRYVLACPDWENVVPPDPRMAEFDAETAKEKGADLNRLPSC